VTQRARAVSVAIGNQFLLCHIITDATKRTYKRCGV